MPLQNLLAGEAAFGPEDIAVLSAAFEAALQRLRLTDRTDPVTKLVARAIFEAAKTGERDPTRLRDQALAAISK